ncbi:MAG TPA: SUMF1/EgtB/PvdO family nonheme iron enzyme [bacterium]|nr:SUMF1/EgtB/PvdO family nonheme iron enzyme [bacterium]
MKQILRNIVFVIITLLVAFVLIGCSDKKNEPIYENYPDESETEKNDEGGCVIVPDKNDEKPDSVPDTLETPDETETVKDEAPDEDLAENDIEIDEGQKNDSELDDEDTEQGACPSDMVENGVYCIDRYEASKKDATHLLQGTDESIAVSKESVLPWMVNPMTEADYQKFKTACTAAGKRLCRDDEWIFSCEGAEKTKYSWGVTYNREICNTVDAFCDEHCETNSIAPENCLMSENCGYSYYCFNVVKTGDFLNCINHSGAFDINGNVWEITDTGSAYKIRGGAFNCGNPSARLECGYNATWSDLFAGFRCCKDR